MAKKRGILLGKRRIAEIAAGRKHSRDELVVLARMAEQHRRDFWAAKRAKKRKPKKYLTSTDYLTVEQLRKIMDVLRSEANAARAKTKCINHAVLNEMLVVLMVETGLRVSEVCNLRLRHLPAYHGKREIVVGEGKGKKDRTVGVSEYLQERLCDYVHCHYSHQSENSWFFRNERGGQLSYDSVYSKIKGIGLKAEIWLYRKHGKVKTRLSPHKFRHTYATLLLDVTGNVFLVQSQLGHEKPDTTQIYAKTLSEKLQQGLDLLHTRLSLAIDGQVRA
ncbi:MAG: tyrosine-type recombinase/integrase [Planctomycetota bacterium]|jgi:integrase/recombinase XerD